MIARDDSRLLADTALTNPMAEKEAELVARLMAEHSPEQIATAFIRKARAGRTAPEDLRDVDDRPPARKPREERGDRDWQDRPQRAERSPREPREWGDREPRAPREPRRERASLEGAVWIAINVGRKKNADPKWLLPMLCKAGGIDRDQIGQIRINSGNTHVELTPEGAERLFETAVNGRLEGSLQAFPLEGIPEREDPGAPPPRDRDRRPERPAASRPERSYERKPDWNPADRPPLAPRPERAERSERPVGKPYEKRSDSRDRPRDEGERPAKAPWSGPKGKSFSGPSKGPGKGPNKGPGKPKTGGKPAGGKGAKPKTFQGLKKPRA